LIAEPAIRGETYAIIAVVTIVATRPATSARPYRGVMKALRE
jgi:hypothetical protein